MRLQDMQIIPVSYTHLDVYKRQQYYYAVRSVCTTSSNVSAWSTVGTFTTYCLPVNTPYYEPFDGPVPNGTTPYHATVGLLLPVCSSQQNIGTGNPWVTSSADYYTGSGMDQNILMYNGQNPGNSNPANVWFYTCLLYTSRCV